MKRARRSLKIWFTGGLMLVAACNRAEPEKDVAIKTSPATPLLVEQETPPAESTQRTDARPEHQSSQLPTSTSSAVNSSANTSVNRPAGEAAERGASQSQPQPNETGVHIEMTDANFATNSLETPAETVPNDELAQRLSDRAFMKLNLPETNDSAQLLAFFVECDRAVQDLAIAQRAEQLNSAEFHEQAKRLSSLKLQAAERLMSLADLSAANKNVATAAQVESLSHLTSLGDVAAAQKLQTLAEQLIASDDVQLAHQGKLVLLGFKLNQLQEGQLKDPRALIADIDHLFVGPEDRGLVELMALQRCAEVLAQLGYAGESQQVLQRIVKEYQDSPDIDLSMRAWSVETNNAPSLVAFHEALQSTFEAEGDPRRVAQAASELLQAFPKFNTLLHVSRFMIPLEFSGNVAAAQELAKVVASARQQFPSSAYGAEIDRFLESHARRVATLGRPLSLDGLATFDGQPFDWTSYRGKVVLVCFWASWEINSLEEIRKLKELRGSITDPDFEIVAINLDDTHMSNAEQMVKRQAYPWQNLRSANPAAVGFETPAAKAVGVNAVPFILLVDRKGEVAGIHVRGERTAQMVSELLNKK